MAPPFRLLGIDHVVLRVRDLDRMLDFYRNVLGCPLERVQADIGLYQLRAGRTLIDLVTVEGRLGQAGGAPPGAEGHNMDHFCLELDRFDPAAIIAHLEGHGVAVGSLGQRYGAQGEGASIYLADPEGNRLELKAPAS